MGWWRDAKKRLKGVGKRGNGVGSGTIVGEDVRSGWGGSGVKSGARGGKKKSPRGRIGKMQQGGSTSWR